MLITPPPLKRNKRRKKTANSANTGPAALVLVSAIYTPDRKLELAFDRDINIDAIQPNVFFYIDGSTSGWLMRGETAEQLTSVLVKLDMSKYSETEDPRDVMNVSDENGIVAVDDGAGWAGATDLLLPYP